MHWQQEKKIDKVDVYEYRKAECIELNRKARLQENARNSLEKN